MAPMMPRNGERDMATPQMLTRTDLSRLLDEQANPAVSAFLPTHVAGREIQQDPIRLRNLLHEARGLLEKQGMRGTEAEDMLRPAYDLVEDGLFWRHQSEGLAVFVNRDGARIHKVPLSLPEEVFVDEGFHIRPLLPALAADGRFVVLSVTLKHAHLYEGTRFGLTEVPLEVLPRGTETLFNAPNRLGEAPEHPTDGTVRKPETANSTDAPAYAVSGSQSLVTNDEVVQYVTQLAGAVDQWMGGTGVPLVLAADERVGGHFKAANRYKGLMDTVIFEHPESMQLSDLHARAYDIVRPLFEQGRKDALDRFRMLSGDGSDRATIDPAAIIAAAINGRVESLFVAERAELWGRWLPDANRAVTHHHRHDGDRELVELAAASVFSSDGRIFHLPTDEMPADTPLAATLRY